jgi:hypothetical protein
VLVLVPAIGFNLQGAREDLRGSSSYLRYAQASAWLVEHSSPGSRVFNTDWDDFTQLFYYNTHNVYMLGLDPTYMHQYDPDLYKLWRSITRGEVSESGQTIRQVFGAEYVITDLRHDRFLNQAEVDPWLQEVYRDEDAAIFLVLAGAD